MARGGQRHYGNAGRSAYGGSTAGGQSRAVLVAADQAGLTLTGGPLNVAVNSAAPFTPVIGGGKAPFALSLVGGALPSGRALVGLSVTGTYTTAGTYSYTLRVTDALGSKRDLVVAATVS